MIATFDEAGFLDVFARLLTQRDELTGFCGEEELRYTFCYALSEAGYRHWQILLEDSLPTYKGRHIDLRTIEQGDLPPMAVEFKFHREGISAPATTRLAGTVLADLARLAVVHHACECLCYFVYLTDHSMLDYLKRQEHGCDDLIGASVGASISFGVERLRGRATSSMQAMKGFLEPGTATCVAATSISSRYELRVFRIEHTPDPLYDYA